MGKKEKPNKPKKNILELSIMPISALERLKGPNNALRKKQRRERNGKEKIST